MPPALIDGQWAAPGMRSPAELKFLNCALRRWRHRRSSTSQGKGSGSRGVYLCLRSPRLGRLASVVPASPGEEQIRKSKSQERTAPPDACSVLLIATFAVPISAPLERTSNGTSFEAGSADHSGQQVIVRATDVVAVKSGARVGVELGWTEMGRIRCRPLDLQSLGSPKAA